MGFSEPFSDIWVGIRVRGVCFQGRELPGLPHPAPFPLSVSHTLRDFLFRALLQPGLMLQPLIGFPSPVMKELQDKSGESHLWL
jgi:hypothetical protein